MNHFSECDDGDYGINCNETCGHCSEASQCHHITGVCSDTCKPGYQGIMCDTGITVFLLCLKVVIVL